MCLLVTYQNLELDILSKACSLQGWLYLLERENPIIINQGEYTAMAADYRLNLSVFARSRTI